MQNYKLAEVEAKFADLIWSNEPISSSELVKLCEQELSWKKSTTYTVLKKLTERGIFQNEKSIVTSKITKKQFLGMQCQKYVEETFGSLPQFLASYFQEKKLTRKEAMDIIEYIDRNTD